MNRLRARILSAALTVAAMVWPASAGAQVWKHAHVTIVVQHSGGNRQAGQTILSALRRLFSAKPETASVTLVGFSSKFEQLEGGRFRRSPAVLLPSTTDGEQVQEAIAALPFNGPSPVYDALLHALNPETEAPRPSLILLISNGMDNSSESSFDEMLKLLEAAKTPVAAFYFPSQPPAGGDTRMRKIAKATGGRFLDIRQKDAWEQLLEIFVGKP